MKEKLLNKRPVVFSRHPTHNVLRSKLPLLPFRSVIRLGSTTELSQRLKLKGNYTECNSIEGILNTSNKIKMKMCFTLAKISSPLWYMPIIGATSKENSLLIASTTNLLQPSGYAGGDVVLGQEVSIASVGFPLIAKINFHSRGRGMLKIDNMEEMLKLLKDPNTARKYTFERHTNFAQEYRVHATKKGIFYICRKLRQEAAEERWFFNSKNSVFQITYNNGEWIKEKILCFKEMEEHCIKALEALKMDIAGFDIRVDSARTRFSIIEANSACSFGEHTAENYIKKIPEVLTDKYNQKNG